MSTYINSGDHVTYGDDCPRHSWEQFTHDRMKWLYGPFYAAERRSQTQADIAAWNRLGSREAA